MKLRVAMLCMSFALMVVPACATPVTYSAESIEARIVDADTKQPLEGVIVVAHWVLEGGIHVDRVGELVILETVTDKTGRFYFSGWGPIRHWKRSRLTNMDPELLLFKSGYEHKRLANPSTKEAIEGKPYPVRRSQWSGKTIELKPFKGTAQQYADHLGSLNNNLYPLLGSETCDWKKIPLMLLALTEQSRAFRKLRIEALYDVDLYLPISERKCGSPSAFFKEYRP